MSQDPPIDLGPSLAGLFIGVFLGAILWGVSCSQVVYYYSAESQDALVIKTMVGLVWVFDTLHQALLFQALYDYCVVHFGNLAFLMTYRRWEIATEAVVMDITAALVQGLYIYRIWILSQRKLVLIAPAIVLLVVAIGLGGLTIYAGAIGEALYLDLFRHERHISAAYFATSGALDVVITVQMLLLLLRSNTSEYASANASTASLIYKLVLFIVGSNFLTAAVTLSIAIVYLTSPSGYYVVPLFIIVTRLYTNSFMAALNMRSYVKHDASEANQVTTSIVRHELGQLRLHMGHHASEREGEGEGEHSPARVDIYGDVTFRAHEEDTEADYKSNPSVVDVRKRTG